MVSNLNPILTPSLADTGATAIWIVCKARNFMVEAPDPQPPSTPSSVEAVAQTSEGTPTTVVPGPPPAPPPPAVASEDEDKHFDIGDGVGRAVEGRPYERQDDQPLYRPLKIFALDPSVSRLEGATALVNVPYETLNAGPEGKLFKVASDESGVPALNLNDHDILINNGLDPSTSDKRFHDQMVYAVCSIVYTAFRVALGRHIAWGFERQEGRSQLLLRPRAFEGNNSHYDRANGELCFGFFRSKAKGDFPGTVYACLSHDTVAHEVTHALLDGLRKHFSLPMSQDVLGFHEGFADIVAVFQHFSYEHVVRAAIRNSRGVLSRSELLTGIARQLGQSSRESKSALRSAIDYADQHARKPNEPPPPPKLYDPALEPHELGSVLVIAVFEAFIAVYKRKTERLVRLATGGSGRLPPGDLPADLQAALAEKASKLAGQFLTMCIRAIDYCPPVDITLGEYLRAVITADKDLVPDDPWAYREAWIDAFRRHHIYPTGVDDLSEDSLLWTPLKRQNPLLSEREIEDLTFRNLKFHGDPGWPADKDELEKQARALGRVITVPEFMSTFGLAKLGDTRLNGDKVFLPKIQSIRSSRRVGPSGQVVFDLIAEVTQKRSARMSETDTCTVYGGSTVIIDPYGRIRYVVLKSVTNNKRVNDQKQFLNSTVGQRHKSSLCAMETPNLFQMLHEDNGSKTDPNARFFALNS
jgi:hypothetical protein